MTAGRVVVVTGAGTGIGRAEALLLAAEGCRVVVNDVDLDTARSVVSEIQAAGGEALANGDDVADWDGAGRLVTAGIQAWGCLDALVNNAGVLRDRMFVSMSVEDWDAVVRVHLRGTFAPTRHAVAYWRDEAKAGRQRVARVVNTSSPSGLYGNVGQTNYAAAKAGVAAMTQVLAQELWRYGVGVNAIAPSALTRMTEGLTGYRERLDALAERPGWAGVESPGDPAHLVALVAWLASPDCTLNGTVLNLRAGHVSVAQGWDVGPAYEKDGPFDVAELDAVVPGLVAQARRQANAYGVPVSYGE